MQVKVRLLADLTRYDFMLAKGVEGYADLDKVKYNDWEEEMVWCKFPEAHGLYVGKRSLEILSKKFWKNREEDVKESYLMEYVHGPRGGFKWIRIYSRNSDGVERIYTTNVKNEGLKLLDMAEKNNIQYVSKIN